MLADFVETQVPAILILNMMDVAKNQGISINTKLLSEKPGIPVVPMSAIQKKDYSLLYETIEHILVHPLFVVSRWDSILWKKPAISPAFPSSLTIRCLRLDCREKRLCCFLWDLAVRLPSPYLAAMAAFSSSCPSFFSCF